jgi:hypothetical protein
MPAERIPLPKVARELRRQNLVDRPLGYREIYIAVLDGRIPAELGGNGRWTVAGDDLPLIGATLSRTAPDVVAA